MSLNNCAIMCYHYCIIAKCVVELKINKEAGQDSVIFREYTFKEKLKYKYRFL